MLPLPAPVATRNSLSVKRLLGPGGLYRYRALIEPHVVGCTGTTDSETKSDTPPELSP
jgi:hypothetical protein